MGTNDFFDEQIEKKILNTIKQKAEYPLTFSEITKTFDKKFKNFNPAKNSLNIAEYFGHGIGQVSAKKTCCRW